VNDEQKTILQRMFLADGTDHGLSSFMAGRSGSGKTYRMTEMINEAIKLPEFKNARFIYMSVKNESYWPKIKPTSSIDDIFKQLEKNHIAVFYPSEPTLYEQELDELIEQVFTLADGNDDTSFCLIVDDCNILDTMSSRSRPSKSMTKAAVAGRSKNIKMLLIVHRLGNLPRILNSSLNAGIVMAISPMDNKYSKDILGLDMEGYYEPLAENKWSWSFVDLLTGDVTLYRANE